MKSFGSTLRIARAMRSRIAPALAAQLLFAVAPANLAAARQTPARQTTPSQSAPRNPPPAAPRATAQRPAASFDIGDYGVRIKSDARLLAVMGALAAAGFEGVPTNASPVGQSLRAANESLDEGLRARLRNFYAANRLTGDATPAQQAARYVSLAFALGDAPGLQAPARTDDLPGGVLEVLDFAPLVREYYDKANTGALLAAYTRETQAAGERLRPGASEMVRTVLNRFRVRPVLTTIERVPAEVAATKDKKKGAEKFVTRERERRFQIVPDPLAVPGAINLRVIADDYFVVLPASANPASAELRRAYIQFLADPLTRRFNREIALRRPDIVKLLTEVNAANKENAAAGTTSVFEAFTRSLVAAVDARVTEAQRLAATANLNQTARAEARRRIADARTAALADAYERGGVLAFYFAEQLDEIDASGFEVTNLLPDIINSFDPARESRRLAEAAEARARDREDARRRAAESAAAASAAETEAADPARAELRRNLAEIETLLQKEKDYPRAEERLRRLLAEHGGDARIFFLLAQAASAGAADATDEAVQRERLSRALANYRLSIQAADREADRALLSRAHTAAGRIYAFLDQTAEAEAAFDAAVKLGDVAGGSFREAQTELARLRGARP